MRKKCVDDSRFSPDLHNDKRVTLNKRQKNEISSSAAFITETNQVMWSPLPDTIPHGRTIMYMVISATEASMMAVGPFSKIFDPGKNGLQLTDDSATRLKNEFADPNVFFSYVPFSNDDTERPAEVRSLEMFLLQNMDVTDKVNIIADTRRTQRWSERKINSMLCKRDPAFFCNCSTTLENLRLWAHERTPGIPRSVEDLETVEFANVLGGLGTISSKLDEIVTFHQKKFHKNHFHEKPLSSKITFIKIHFHPKPLSSENHFHQETTFIKIQFSSNLGPQTLNPKHLNPKHQNPKHQNPKHQNPKHLKPQTPETPNT